MAALLRHNSKINMTKNRESVIFQKNSDMIFLQYHVYDDQSLVIFSVHLFFESGYLSHMV